MSLKKTVNEDEQGEGIDFHTIFKVAKAVIILILSVLYDSVMFFVNLLVPKNHRQCDVTGKVTLITGGGSGIGRELAYKMASKGSTIVVWDINTQGNNETAQHIRTEGGKCFAYTVDITDRLAVYRTAETVKEEVGKVDILVNNAGIVAGKKLLDLSDDMIVTTFNVNTISHFWTVKAFLPDMMKHNSGHIVTISSLTGKIALNRLVDYSASKAATIGFDDGLQCELLVDGYTGIYTTCVLPYAIKTDMFKGAQAKIFAMLTPEYVVEEITEAILLRKREVILPKYLIPTVMLKGLVSYRTFFGLSEALGAYDLMNTFVGKSKKN